MLLGWKALTLVIYKYLQSHEKTLSCKALPGQGGASLPTGTSALLTLMTSRDSLTLEEGFPLTNCFGYRK